MKKHIAFSLASILALQLNVAAQVSEEEPIDEIIPIEEPDGSEDQGESCAVTDDDVPVCGVDGYTYANKCFAVSEGVDIDYEGECKYAYDDCSDDSCVMKVVEDSGSNCDSDTSSGGGVLDWLFFLAGSANNNDVSSESASTKILLGSYNRIIADYVFLELQNTMPIPTTATAVVIDKDGVQIGATEVTIPGDGRTDVDIHSLADGSFGSIRVLYTADPSVFKATVSQYKASPSGELTPVSSQVLTQASNGSV